MGRITVMCSVSGVLIMSATIVGISAPPSPEPFSWDDSCPRDSTGTRTDDPYFSKLGLGVPGNPAANSISYLIRLRSELLETWGFGHLEQPEDARILADPVDSDTCRRISELLSEAGEDPTDRWVYFDTGRGHLLLRWRTTPTEGGSIIIWHGVAQTVGTVDPRLERLELWTY